MSSHDELSRLSLSNYRPLNWNQRSIWLDHENSDPMKRAEHNLHVLVLSSIKLSQAEHRELAFWLLRSHEAFRTQIHILDRGEPRQKQADVDPGLSESLLDCQYLVVENCGEEKAQLAVDDSMLRSFDLASDLLLRSIALVKDDVMEIHFVVHHLAIDRAGVSQLRREVENWLAGIDRVGATDDLTRSAQQAYEVGSRGLRALSRARGYWRSQLDFCGPTNFPSRAAFGGDTRVVGVTLTDGRLGVSARATANEIGTSTSGVYLGAFALALATLTLTPSVTVKALWSNRSLDWQRRFRGPLFLPTLLVLGPGIDTSLKECAIQAGDKLLRAARHAYAPYDEFLEEVARSANTRGIPIFLGTVFNFGTSSVESRTDVPDNVIVDDRLEGNSSEHCIFTVSQEPKRAELKLLAQRRIMDEPTAVLLVEAVRDIVSCGLDERAVGRVLDRLRRARGTHAMVAEDGWTLVRDMWVNVNAMVDCLSDVRDVVRAELDRKALTDGVLDLTVTVSGEVDPAVLRSAVLTRMYETPGVRVPDSLRILADRDLAVADAASSRCANYSDDFLGFRRDIEEILGRQLSDVESWCQAGGRYLEIPAIRQRATEYGVELPSVHRIGTATPLVSLIRESWVQKSVSST